MGFFDFLRPPYNFKKRVIGLLFGIGLFIVTIFVGSFLGGFLVNRGGPLDDVASLVASLGYVITGLYFVIFFGLLVYDSFKNWGKKQ